MTRGIDMLGAERCEIGDGIPIYGGILATLGNLGQGIVAAQEKSEAEDKAKEADASKLAAVVAADVKAAAAKATALTSVEASKKTAPKNKNKATVDAKASADEAALSVASSAQDAAATGLSPAAAAKRVEAAQAAYAAATAKLQTTPTSSILKSYVAAWQWVLDKCNNKQITANVSDAGKPAEKPSEPSFLSKQVVGPLKVWHLGVTVVGVGGIIAAFKFGLFKRLFGGK